MFDTIKLKDHYLNAINGTSESGYILYKEFGELTRQFKRNGNTIDKRVFGVFVCSPATITAIKVPFCCTMSAEATFIASPDRAHEVADNLNNIANDLNGTMFTIEDAGHSYSVSLNIQTATIGEKIEIATGMGEVHPIRQIITYVIIEDGVSAYDCTITIDGIECPILTLVESKTHTTTMLANENGRGETTSDLEAYGIDFTTPAVQNDLGDLFEEALSENTSNTAHSVVITKAGNVSCHIMQFTMAKATLQPPQNVGYNISMTEVKPSLAELPGGYWQTIAVPSSARTLGFFNVEKRNDSEGIVVYYGNGRAVRTQNSSAFCPCLTEEDYTAPVYVFNEYKSIYVSGTQNLSHDVLAVPKETLKAEDYDDLTSIDGVVFVNTTDKKYFAYDSAGEMITIGTEIHKREKVYIKAQQGINLQHFKVRRSDL